MVLPRDFKTSFLENVCETTSMEGMKIKRATTIQVKYFQQRPHYCVTNYNPLIFKSNVIRCREESSSSEEGSNYSSMNSDSEEHLESWSSVNGLIILELDSNKKKDKEEIVEPRHVASRHKKQNIFVQGTIS